MLVSQASKEIMQTHYKAIGGDMNKSWSNRMKSAMVENFQKAQVELINRHWNNMDADTQKRALRTLKQLGG